MKLRLFLPALVILFAAPAVLAKPNVIVLITDDQGWPELSAHGNPVLRTPHLDAVHAASLRLTDFHVAPMCTPTRGQLMTGLDAARNGAINVSSGRSLLRRDLRTMADCFRDAGYATGLFGKWHLGDNYPFRPQDRGFSEALWFPSSHVNSTPDHWDNDYFDDTYLHRDTPRRVEGYCTDVFFDASIEWMRGAARAGKPFFTYLATNAPHSPHWVPEPHRIAMENEYATAEAAGRIPKLPKGRRAELIRYLAMIRHLDAAVGRLDAFLKEAGLFENTILVFLTDNGSTFAEDYYPAGMRGRKTQLWEGGHRVPCFLRWPGGPLGDPRDIDGLTQVQDLLPTLLGLGGIPVRGEAFDGIDLGPVLTGQAAADPDRKLVINYSRMPRGCEFAAPDAPSLMRREGAAVLWKRWRLIEDRELYDLESDPLQERNVIDAHPEVLATMRSHLDEWWRKVGDQANEPGRIIIGHEAENPLRLTACEWLDVFIDQQRQIRRADLKNGWWELEVAEAGDYTFELRRWPAESGIALREGVGATEVTDGTLLPGRALDIRAARIRVGEQEQSKPVEEGDRAATFELTLPAGPIRLYTWFDDGDGQAIVGAYYVTVERK